MEGGPPSRSLCSVSATGQHSSKGPHSGVGREWGRGSLAHVLGVTPCPLPDRSVARRHPLGFSFCLTQSPAWLQPLDKECFQERVSADKPQICSFISDLCMRGGCYRACIHSSRGQGVQARAEAASAFSKGSKGGTKCSFISQHLLSIVCSVRPSLNGTGGKKKDWGPHHHHL